MTNTTDKTTDKQVKHTAGPWEVGQDGLSVWGKHIGKVNPCIAKGLGQAQGQDVETILANAALIAAAPELLEALKAWEYARNEGGISMVDWFEVARKKTREAIAKAEGGRS